MSYQVETLQWLVTVLLSTVTSWLRWFCQFSPSFPHCTLWWKLPCKSHTGGVARMIHLLEVGEHLPTPAFLLGKSLGQRNLVGYSPWGHKALDMIEHLTLPSPIHTYIYIYNIYIIYIYSGFRFINLYPHPHGKCSSWVDKVLSCIFFAFSLAVSTQIQISVDQYSLHLLPSVTSLHDV